ncbi:MAG: YcgJ family protein [Cyanobium sp.]|jgi:hypothetical protein
MPLPLDASSFPRSPLRLLASGLVGAVAVGGGMLPALAQAFGTPLPGAYPGPGLAPGPGIPASNTPPANISFPAPGVICDQVYKLCYTSQGISQPLSATTFGQAGIASAMLAMQRGLQKQFLLSNGTYCDVSVPACWSDGMGRRIPSVLMSNQLFYGRNPGLPVSPGRPGGNTAGFATCRLQQGFQVIYSGQCQLMRQQEGNRFRFNAQLGNGTTYSFVNRNGNYRIRDNSGVIWPVNYVDQGSTGVFNWAGYSLTLTQPGYPSGPSLGRSIGNLLESLFQ